jgi:hypothetical protein
MEAEIISETSKIFSTSIRLSVRQGFISLCSRKIPNFDNAILYCFSTTRATCKLVKSQNVEVGGTYTMALTKKKCREKGNFHDQDSDNKRAEFIANRLLQGNATFLVYSPTQGSRNYVNSYSKKINTI